MTDAFPWAVLVAVVWQTHALTRAWLTDRHEERRVTRERIAAERAVADAEARRADRKVEVKEREVALHERIKSPPTPVPVWPADILSLVRSWDEDWARNDMEKVILETYGKTQDWAAVRNALKPWHRTDSPVSIE